MSHSTPGFFGLDCNSFGFSVAKDIGIAIYPRDAEELESATKYHIDCGGFKTEEDAISAGEELRKRLRLLNSLLDLGLTIPLTDSVTGKIADSIKENATKKGGVLLDSRIGLSAIPDDDKHFEVVASGDLRATPSDPIFLFEAIKKIWELELEFDGKVEDVIELLNISSVEKSPKIKFLTVYLALEQLITVKERSEQAQSLISEFIDQTNSSDIPENEKASLVGSLSNLKNGSFSGALKNFAKGVTSPSEIQGYKPEKLASKAIELRNKIAHKVEIPQGIDVNNITKGIREMVFGILATKYGIPNFSVYRPPDKVSSDRFEIRIL